MLVFPGKDLTFVTILNPLGPPIIHHALWQSYAMNTTINCYVTSLQKRFAVSMSFGIEVF